MTALLIALASMLLAHGDTGGLELTDRTAAGEATMHDVGLTDSHGQLMSQADVTVDPATTSTTDRTRDEVAEEAGGAWWLLVVMAAFAAAMVVVAVAFFRGRSSPSTPPER